MKKNSKSAPVETALDLPAQRTPNSKNPVVFTEAERDRWSVSTVPRVRKHFEEHAVCLRAMRSCSRFHYEHALLVKSRDPAYWYLTKQLAFVLWSPVESTILRQPPVRLDTDYGAIARPMGNRLAPVMTFLGKHLVGDRLSFTQVVGPPSALLHALPPAIVPGLGCATCSRSSRSLG